MGGRGDNLPTVRAPLEALDPNRAESLSLPLPAASTVLPYQERCWTAQGSPRKG